MLIKTLINTTVLPIQYCQNISTKINLPFDKVQVIYLQITILKFTKMQAFRSVEIYKYLYKISYIKNLQSTYFATCKRKRMASMSAFCGILMVQVLNAGDTQNSAPRAMSTRCHFPVTTRPSPSNSGNLFFLHNDNLWLYVLSNETQELQTYLDTQIYLHTMITRLILITRIYLLYRLSLIIRFTDEIGLSSTILSENLSWAGSIPYCTGKGTFKVITTCSTAWQKCL